MCVWGGVMVGGGGGCLSVARIVGCLDVVRMIDI